MTLFILMFLAHCIDDFFLQGGCLVNLKQKSWWEKQAPDAKYSKDYLMGLFIHAFEWSAMFPGQENPKNPFSSLRLRTFRTRW